jgi:hypothetical protein
LGWEPHVVLKETGAAMSEAVPGPKGEELIGARPVPYAPCLTVEEAQEKACREVTCRYDPDGEVRSCRESGIIWQRADSD